MRPPEALPTYEEGPPTGTELEPGPPPEVPRDPSRIAWTRRRASAGRIWRTYRKNTLGMIGLAVLILFALVAIFAPLLANKEGLKATCPCNGIPFSPPSLHPRIFMTS